MNKRLWIVAGVVVGLIVGTMFVSRFALTQAADPAAPGDQPKAAASKVTAVTVYQNNALITREVEVPEGAGTIEVVVTPLPPQTINSSLYSEGSEDIRVLSTRFRTRPMKEDTREEVRKAEADLHKLALDAQKLQSDSKTITENMALLGKLENFTAATTQHATEKGNLNSDSAIALSDHVMKKRDEMAKQLVETQQKIQANGEQTEFVKRQLTELAAGTNKTERDAVIVVDKKNAAAGKVRLNYLVDSATWRPQYKLRAGKDKDPIRVEYLAAIAQQTGEDWKDVKLTLSTAQPMFNAAPPELRSLAVGIMPRGNNPMATVGVPNLPGSLAGQTGAQGGGAVPPAGATGVGNYLNSAKDYQDLAKNLRSQALVEFNKQNKEEAVKSVNEAAVVEQTFDLLAAKDDGFVFKGKPSAGGREGQSVTYHLPSKLTVPSRNDEQVIEVTRLEMNPDYFYKAVPVLTPHVFRLANLTNKSEHVLLPGEATMYLGSDFVGRQNLPLVAIGEQFTAGFGVDPQLQVQRHMVDKSRTMKGGNQVLTYEYNILASSYKADAVNLQIWDRLPTAETETMGVTLMKAEPEVSNDPIYAREEKTHNLLRWDLKLDSGMNGEKAKVIKYEFKLELDKQMMLGSFTVR
jgi:hypothetical protein